MSDKIKTTHKIFHAGQYRTEARYYDAMSEKGWQVIKFGLFSQEYQKNDSVRYRYQFDFRRKPNDFGRYLETFREQGWEYVNSTFNGWYLFRKPYDPALPESEYEIYTDTQSVKAIQKRLTVFFFIMTVLGLSILGFDTVHTVIRCQIPNLIACLRDVILVGIGITGIVIVKREPKKTARKAFPFGWVLCVFFALCISGGILASLRPYYDCHSQADYWVAPELMDEFHVNYADFYYINLTFDGDAPLTVSVVSSESGDVVYTVCGDSLSEENHRLYLKSGDYRIYLSDFSGGKMKLDYEIS